MEYRLSLDLGTSSIGFAILRLNNKSRPISIEKLGVRIFSDGRDPKTKTSLAVERREARASRRRNDRLAQRKKTLLNYLICLKLFPESKNKSLALKTLNPWELRHKAIRNKLNNFELGRVFIHLNQRRGFKSNRKSLSEKEDGIVKTSILELHNLIEKSGERTLGSYLYAQLKKGEIIRNKPDMNLYTSRDMYLDEFNQIVNFQKDFHKDIQEEDWKKIKEILFHQRPLKPQEKGRCLVFENENRAERSLASYQAYKIIQDLSNLRILTKDFKNREINIKDKKIIFDQLCKCKTKKFSTLRKQLGLNESEKFNLEGHSRDHLKGDETSSLLSNKDYFGSKWYEKNLHEKDEIIKFLISNEDEDLVFKKAIKDWNLDKSKAVNLSKLNINKFPQGTCSFSQKALLWINEKTIEEFKNINYLMSEELAAKLEIESMTKLGYYAKVLPKVAMNFPTSPSSSEEEKLYGKIGNPTVHNALNQLRKVVNKIIDIYGNPKEIVIELARDLKNPQSVKSEINKFNLKNLKNNERIIQAIKEIDENLLKSNKKELITKYKLWEELSTDKLNRCCPYSGKVISCKDIFSEIIHIDHILPFSRTLDDTFNNKTVCYAFANAKKLNRSPYEAFKNEKGDFSYENILLRIKSFSRDKQKRFQINAMEEHEGQNKWLSRHINDTAYLSKISSQYLRSISKSVWTSSGRLTSILRYQWGLNRILSNGYNKNRSDHRHHAIDALVIGFCDRSLVQLASKTNKVGEKIQISTPWNKFYENTKQHIDNMTVSHKLDQSTKGKIFADTTYGKIDPLLNDGIFMSTRKEVESFRINDKKINDIVDKNLRNYILSEEIESNDKLHNVIKCFYKHTPKKIKIAFRRNNDPITIIHPSKNPSHQKFLLSSSNNCILIWKVKSDVELREKKIEGYTQVCIINKGKKFFKFIVQSLTNYAAQKYGINEYWKPHPSAKKLLVLHKGDMVDYFKSEDDYGIARVKSLDPKNKRIYITPHNYAVLDNNNDDDKNKIKICITFNQIISEGIMKIYVDELGNIKRGKNIFGKRENH